MADENVSRDQIEYYFELFDKYRSYVVHEDDLVNRRLSRFLTVQAALVAAFSFISSSIFDIFIATNAPNYIDLSSEELDNLQSSLLYSNIMLYLFPFIGLLSAFYSSKSIGAAEDSIRGLEEKWASIVSKNLDRIPDLGDLPNLTGGEDNEAPKKGFLSTKFALRSAIVFWILLIVFHFIVNHSDAVLESLCRFG